MRKIVLFISLIFSCLCINAQKTVHGSGFLDDWSVNVLAGVTTPTTHSAFFGNMRPTYGLEMTKYIVPEFALGAQLLTAHNTTASSTVFDASHLMLMGNINLSNLFASYIGRPRSFELIAVVGAGWGHHYNNRALGEDYNFMVSKFGLNLKFFLDRKQYAWALAVKPSIVYNMDAGHTEPSYNINRSALELLFGLTYHFKNSNNGKHYFTQVRLYDPTAIDALNAKVNDLYEIVSERDAQLEKANEEIQRLKNQIQQEKSK